VEEHIADELPRQELIGREIVESTVLLNQHTEMWHELTGDKNDDIDNQ
jgi:hypothetical protein